MNRDERTGLILLLVFLVVCGVFLASTTGGGQAFTNIFSNIIVDTDYAPSAAVEAQLEPIKQPLGTYWLIGSTALVAGLVTLCAIVVCLVTRRRVPRSWCYLLVLLGASLGVLIVAALQAQTQLAAIPEPAPPVSSSTYEGLIGEIGLLKLIGSLGSIFILIGAVLAGWSSRRQRQLNKA